MRYAEFLKKDGVIGFGLHLSDVPLNPTEVHLTVQKKSLQGGDIFL